MKTKFINIQIAIAAILLCIGLASCSSPQKLAEQGDYDEAIRLAIKKIAGKKNKSDKHVASLEYAFEKATKRDMARIEDLKANISESKWIRIHDLNSKIQRRQELVEPLLPLYDKYGSKADFRFVRVDNMLQESSEAAAAYLYDHASELLVLAEKGDKQAARKAYEELSRIPQYQTNYKDRLALMSVAHDLGITRIFFQMENEASVILPAAFEKELLNISVNEINENWRAFYTKKDPAINFDYNITMKIKNIEVSPERVQESIYVDEKEIKDGWEYEYDRNGNVQKDSLGNDIKRDRWIITRANVIEVLQTKAAVVSGRLEFRNNRNNELVKTESISVESVFENYASTFNGDIRALSNRSRNRMGNQPLPFPTDERLLLDAAANLKPIVKDKITFDYLAGI